MPVRESPAVPLAIPPGKRLSEKHGRGWRLRTRVAQAGQAFSQLQRVFRPPVGFLFTLRTTLAALIALGLAFWMELDSPAWAPLTVWVVAQPTRGESLSKARWRIVGTLAGGVFAILLSAVLPQAPWLFFIVLALWTGLCTGCASFATNFRAYAWSLAGFTGAIIAVDAAPDANHVFPVAMSRCTYIMLGIVCELSVAAIFSADPSKQARRALHLSLVQALQHVGQILSSALDNRPETLERAEHELGAVLGLDNRIEFLALEIGPHTRVGDHARAASAALGSALSRVFGAALQLQGQEDLQSVLKTFEAKAPELSEASTNEGLGRGPVGQEAVFSQAQNLLARLEEVTRISDPALFLQVVPELCAQLKTLRQNCLTALKVIVINVREKSYDNVTYTSDNPSDKLFLSPIAALQVCLTALASVLGDLETAVQQIEASATSAPGDRFRFARVPWHDTVSAWQNGLRAVVAVLFTALVYEVTAWTEGLPYIVYTAVICCVFGPRPQQITATLGYLYGTIAAAFVAFWVVVLGIPAVALMSL